MERKSEPFDPERLSQLKTFLQKAPRRRRGIERAVSLSRRQPTNQERLRSYINALARDVTANIPPMRRIIEPARKILLANHRLIQHYAVMIDLDSLESRCRVAKSLPASRVSPSVTLEQYREVYRNIYDSEGLIAALEAAEQLQHQEHARQEQETTPSPQQPQEQRGETIIDRIIADLDHEGNWGDAWGLATVSGRHRRASEICEGKERNNYWAAHAAEQAGQLRRAISLYRTYDPYNKKYTATTIARLEQRLQEEGEHPPEENVITRVDTLVELLETTNPSLAEEVRKRARRLEPRVPELKQQSTMDGSGGQADATPTDFRKDDKSEPVSSLTQAVETYAAGHSAPETTQIVTVGTESFAVKPAPPRDLSSLKDELRQDRYVPGQAAGQRQRTLDELVTPENIGRLREFFTDAQLRCGGLTEQYDQFNEQYERDGNLGGSRTDLFRYLQEIHRIWKDDTDHFDLLIELLSRVEEAEPDKVFDHLTRAKARDFTLYTERQRAEYAKIISTPIEDDDTSLLNLLDSYRDFFYHLSHSSTRDGRDALLDYAESLHGGRATKEHEAPEAARLEDLTGEGAEREQSTKPQIAIPVEELEQRIIHSIESAQSQRRVTRQYVSDDTYNRQRSQRVHINLSPARNEQPERTWRTEIVENALPIAVFVGGAVVGAGIGVYSIYRNLPSWLKDLDVLREVIGIKQIVSMMFNSKVIGGGLVGAVASLAASIAISYGLEQWQERRKNTESTAYDPRSIDTAAYDASVKAQFGAVQKLVVETNDLAREYTARGGSFTLQSGHIDLMGRIIRQADIFYSSPEGERLQYYTKIDDRNVTDSEAFREAGNLLYCMDRMQEIITTSASKSTPALAEAARTIGKEVDKILKIGLKDSIASYTR